MTQSEASTAADAALPINDNVVSIKPRRGPKRTTSQGDDLTEGGIEEAKALAQKIRQTLGKQLTAVVEVGVDLLKVKALVGHGNFRKWLGDEFSWSERTASSYMELARHFEGKTANFAGLDLGTARALVADSMPAKIRDELFKRAKDGETITGEEVRKRVAESNAADSKPTSKAKQAEPNDSTKVEARAAMGESTAANVADGVLNLLYCVERSRPDCDPGDVVKLILESGDERIPPNIKLSGQFVLDVLAGLAAQMPPGSEIESELELAS